MSPVTTLAGFEPAFCTAEQSHITRIGLIVPSSNITMETELPELLRRQTEATGMRYTFHSARASLKNVTKEELLAMVAKAGECAKQVSDADVKVIAYACLVAVMAQGAGAHEPSEEVIAKAAADNGHPAAVVSSAGALVRVLQEIGAKRIAMITPYMPALTQTVSDYVTGAGIEVTEAVALAVSDNLQVGCLDTGNLRTLAAGIDPSTVDAVILSACVQMPSADAIEPVEQALGVPVISAATATTFEILKALGHQPQIPNAGRLLRGELLTVAAAS